MVAVQVKPFYNLREIIGNPILEMNIEEGTTIRALLEQLMEIYGSKLQKALIDPETGAIHSFYRILVTGRDVRLLDHGIDTRLKDGDVISLLQAISGGSS